MERIGVYARLSRDPDGTQTSTARQIADCRATAEGHGWDVVDVYEDVDLSAFRDVLRPQYERMLADVIDRRIDGVLVWKLDRLVRSPREFERFWQTCETAGASLASVHDPIDTSSELGMIIVRLLVGFARLESVNISIRTRSAQEQRAKAGRLHGGGQRPYGLTPDRTAVDEVEAANVREAAGRLVAGDSMRSIAKDWQARGILSPNRREWSQQTLRSMLLSPRLAGQRQHYGEIVGEGSIPAILDVDTHNQVVAILTAPGRRSGRPTNHYLLAGMLRCGRCGARMFTHQLQRGQRRYRCIREPQRGGGCGTVFILAEPLEELVSDMALQVLDSPELEAGILERAKRSERAAEADRLHLDEQALVELSHDYYVDRRIGRAEFLAAREPLEVRIEQARRHLAAETGTQAVRALRDGSGRQAWPQLPFDRRRAVLSELLEEVRIAPGRRGFPRFDPSRVEPVWKA